MAMRFLREVESVKQAILRIGAKVEENQRKAIRSVERSEPRLAREVIDSDHQIDHMEVELEEEVLKILALYQPVAIDLRFLIAVLKINNDLERIGDMAANIAQWTLFNQNQAGVSVPMELSQMAEVVQRMLKLSLDAVVRLDPALALEVCRTDDEVDSLHRHMYRRIEELIRAEPDKIEPLIHLLGVSRNLERSADLTTNIAEDVIYTVKGEIIRHRKSDFIAQDAP